MSSKIQQVLAKITECEPRKDETINDDSYKRRLAAAVSELGDSDWDKLPDEAQDYANKVSDLINANKTTDLPAWPDLKEEAAASGGRRRTRASDDDDKEGSKPTAGYKAVDVDTLKKGDKVRITNKRDKVYEGTVIDPDDKGELVLEVDKEEIGVDLDRVAKAEVWAEAPAEEGKTSRRRKAEDDEQPEVLEPEVSDTVELVTMRDKVVVGNVVEMDKDTIVVKDASGDELEFNRERIKSIKVKVKNAGKTDEGKPEGRSRSKAGDDKGDEKPSEGKRTRSVAKTEEGVSATTRIRELIVENMDASAEQIGKLLEKEKLSAKDNTLKLIYSDVHKLLKMLRERKLLK